MEPQFELAAKHGRGRDPDRERALIVNWLKNGPTMTYLRCWYAGQSESDGMWKVYGETSESVAIRSSVKRLLDTLPDDVFLIPVRYLLPGDVRLPSEHRLWQFAFKRPEFAYESELRCVKFDASDSRPTHGHQVAISISTLVEGVVVSPHVPSWFTSTVQAVVARLGLPIDPLCQTSCRVRFFDG